MNNKDKARAARAAPGELTESQIQKGLMALLQCSASDLESYSPKMLDGYIDDVYRIAAALNHTKEQSK